MNRADAHRRQHRKHRLRNHRHVDQYAITFGYAEALQHRGGAVYLVVQFFVRVLRFGVGLGGNEVQRNLIAARRNVTINGVVTKVRRAAHKPFGKRRTREIADLRERRVPVNELRLLRPKRISRIDRAVEMFLISTHHILLELRAT